MQLSQLVLVTNESQSSATNLLLTQLPTCSWWSSCRMYSPFNCLLLI